MRKYWKLALLGGLVGAASPAFGQTLSGPMAAPNADTEGASEEAVPTAPDQPIEEASVQAGDVAAPVADSVDAAAGELGSNAAAAAADGEEGVQQRRGSRMVEEIIVTAQKRSENLADVPLSIQAIGAEALEARGIANQKDLMIATPSLDVGEQSGFASIFLRGVGSDAWLTADPSVAAYIDGVYYSFTPSIIGEFGPSVERVEVLKGPQGTLFGRNAVGGALVVHTKDPDLQQSSTTVEAGYGNFDSYRLSLYTSQPLTDTLAVNISAYYNNRDTYLKGEGAGHPWGREARSGVHMKLRWQPVEDLDIIGAIIRTDTQDNGVTGQNLYPSPLAQLTGIPAQPEYTAYTDERTYNNSQGTVFSGELRYTMPWLDLVVLASEQHHKTNWIFDFDLSTQPLVSFDISRHYTIIRQADIQLISNEGSWGSDWLTFTGGFFWYDNPEQGFDPIQVTVGNFQPRRLEAQGIVLPQPIRNALDAFWGPQGILGPLLDRVSPTGDAYFYLNNTALLETQSWSTYLQTTAKITDWFSLTLGGRYQSEKRGVKDSETRLGILGDPDGTVLIPWTEGRDENENPVPLSHTTKGFKPKVSLEFRPFEDQTLIWATFQQAVKAHAYNAYAIYLPPSYVKPEETDAYEIGLRTRLFEGTTSFTAAAFLYKTKDLQTQFISLLAGGAITFENAGGAESKGIDFDLTAQLFPSMLDGWALSLNGAWIDATYTDFRNASGYDEETGLFSQNNDFTGNRMLRSPEYTGSIALTKTWEVSNGYIELGGNYYYNSGMYLTASNDPKREQTSYGLVGAALTYSYEPWGVKVRATGTNLTNEFVLMGVTDTDWGPNFTVAPPRMYGVAVSWTF